MKIQPLVSDFIMPTKGSNAAGAFDIYMPEAGFVDGNSELIGLGFAAAVPNGFVGLLLPRSSAGAKHGVELNNTCGVIDSDYTGEWKAALKTKSGKPYYWLKADRVVQFLIVPVATVSLELVNELPKSGRGEGGFGSTGK